MPLLQVLKAHNKGHYWERFSTGTKKCSEKKNKLEASRYIMLLCSMSMFHEAFLIISDTDLKITNTNCQFAKQLSILNCPSSSKIMK